MKNRFKHITRSLSIAALAVLAVAGFTGCKMSHRDRAEHAAKYMGRQLDLNEAQKLELETLAKQAAEDFKSLKPERKAMMEEIEKQILAEKADTTEIKKQMAAQQIKRQQLTEKWMAKATEFHAKLNPEQKQKAAKLMKKFSKKFKDRVEDDDDSSNRE